MTILGLSELFETLTARLDSIVPDRNALQWFISQKV